MPSCNITLLGGNIDGQKNIHKFKMQVYFSHGLEDAFGGNRWLLLHFKIYVYDKLFIWVEATLSAQKKHIMEL